MTSLTPFTCGHALHLAGSYIDSELTPELQAVMDSHLNRCEKCMAHINFERALKESVQRSCVCEPAPEHLRQRVIQSLSTHRVEWTTGFIVTQTITFEIRSDD